MDIMLVADTDGFIFVSALYGVGYMLRVWDQILRLDRMPATLARSRNNGRLRPRTRALWT